MLQNFRVILKELEFKLNKFKKVKYSVLIVLFYISFSSFSQQIDIKSLKWKNRVILIISDTKDNTLYREQIHEYINLPDAFNDRKLKIIDIQQNRYRTISYFKDKTVIGTWISNTSLYTKYSSKQSNFKVVLLGLDGGTKKIIRDQVFSRTLLFTLIDGMPMRKAELRKN